MSQVVETTVRRGQKRGRPASLEAEPQHVKYHEPPTVLKKNAHLTVVFGRLVRPRRVEDFHGYAVFNGKYLVDQSYDVPDKTRWQEALFVGEIFSTRCYYFYNCICDWTDSPDGPIYRIKRINKILRVSLNHAIIPQLLGELGVTQISAQMMCNQAISCGPQLVGNQLEEAIKRTYPGILELLGRSEYYLNYNRVRIAQAFPNASEKFADLDIGELLENLERNPYETIVERVDDWELWEVSVDGLIEAIPSLIDKVSALHVLRTICDRRKESGSMVFLPDSIKRFVPASRRDGFDAGFNGLITAGIVRKSEIALSYYYLTVDFILVKRLVACLLRIAQNFYTMTKDPITDARIQHFLDDPHFTAGQKACFKHIKENPFTWITGVAGAGKTEVISEAVNGLFNMKCVVGTFIGYHAARLKNERIGIGCTMHSIIADLKRVNDGKHSYMTKVINGTALFVDEVANLSMRTFVEVLEALILKPGVAKAKRVPLCRIIGAGDPDQIPPIGVGSIGSDFMKFMDSAVIRLTENMRVDMESRALVEMDQALLNDRDVIPFFKTEFDPKAPMLLLPPSKFEETLPKLLHNRNPRDFIFLGLEKVDVNYLSNCIDREIRKGVTNSNAIGKLMEVGSRIMITKRFFPKRNVTADVVSDQVCNGQYFTVDRIYGCNTRNTERNEIPVVYRNVELVAGTYILVTTKEGTQFCIGKNCVDPECISPTPAATVNKLQGGESDDVVCYLPDATGNKSCWKLPHLHVIMTRAKKRLTILASPDVLRAMAKRKIPRRLTGVESAIQQLLPVISDKKLCLSYENKPLPITL